MRKNFTVDQENAILCDGVLYDLHNCYSIESLMLNSHCVECAFEPHHIHGRGLKAVKLTSLGIMHLDIEQEDNVPLAEYLDRIGYAEANQNTLSYLLSEEQSNPECHLVLDFDICTLRIGAEKFVFTVQD